MGYHVAIVRTGKSNGICQEEIESLGQGQHGFSIVRDGSGQIQNISLQQSGEELVLFFDQNELWTKNPTDTALGMMIDIANSFGASARVRGDEGETYESSTSTYIHPEDAGNRADSPRFYWRDVVSMGPPVVGVLLLLYGIIRLMIKHLAQH